MDATRRVAVAMAGAGHIAIEAACLGVRAVVAVDSCSKRLDAVLAHALGLGVGDRLGVLVGGLEALAGHEVRPAPFLTRWMPSLSILLCATAPMLASHDRVSFAAAHPPGPSAHSHSEMAARQCQMHYNCICMCTNPLRHLPKAC